MVIVHLDYWQRWKVVLVPNRLYCLFVDYTEQMVYIVDLYFIEELQMLDKIYVQCYIHVGNRAMSKYVLR